MIECCQCGSTADDAWVIQGMGGDDAHCCTRETAYGTYAPGGEPEFLGYLDEAGNLTDDPHVDWDAVEARIAERRVWSDRP